MKCRPADPEATTISILPFSHYLLSQIDEAGDMDLHAACACMCAVSPGLASGSGRLRGSDIDLVDALACDVTEREVTYTSLLPMINTVWRRMPGVDLSTEYEQYTQTFVEIVG